jgi:hypothetical protein
MLPTIAKEINKAFIEDFLSFSLGAFLIYKPDLGLDDTPTEQEFSNRKELTMMEAVKYEVGGPSLNGYKRHLITNVNTTYTNSFASLSLIAEFEALGGSMGPFTHICLARGVNIYAPPNTGYGRGDPQGNLILVKPVPTRPLPSIPHRPDIPIGSPGLLLEAPETYRAHLQLNISARVLGA